MENWEGCKENVLPSKRGRNVKDLNNQLDKPFLKTSKVENIQEKYFENKLNETGKTSEEILDVYVSYIKWARDTYPTNPDKSLKILEVQICYLIFDLYKVIL